MQKQREALCKSGMNPTIILHTHEPHFFHLLIVVYFATIQSVVEMNVLCGHYKHNISLFFCILLILFYSFSFVCPDLCPFLSRLTPNYFKFIYSYIQIKCISTSLLSFFLILPTNPSKVPIPLEYVRRAQSLKLIKINKFIM